MFRNRQAVSKIAIFGTNASWPWNNNPDISS